MKTQKYYHSRGEEYSYTVVLEFENLDTSSETEEPANGRIKINLSEEFPHPVEVDIKDEMEAGGNKNARYVEFEDRSQTLEEPTESPAEFKFITKPSQPSTRGGGKCYSFKTADYDPNANIDPKKDSEFIEHHVAIPSAQRIRIIHSILKSNGDRNTIQEIANLYDENHTYAADDFSSDVKKYVEFESIISIQNFLIGNTGMQRSPSDTINKVAKQITRERLRYRTQSLQDVEEMIAVINSQENFPNISKKEIFNEVAQRSNKTELEEIADSLGIDDWSVVLS